MRVFMLPDVDADAAAWMAPGRECFHRDSARPAAYAAARPSPPRASRGAVSCGPGSAMFTRCAAANPNHRDARRIGPAMP